MKIIPKIPSCKFEVGNKILNVKSTNEYFICFSSKLDYEYVKTKLELIITEVDNVLFLEFEIISINDIIKITPNGTICNVLVRDFLPPFTYLLLPVQEINKCTFCRS